MQLKVPPVATAVQVMTPSTRTVTVLFASAVPLKVGDVLLLTLPATGVFNSGASGALTSMVKLTLGVDCVALPAASAAVASALCVPSLSGAVGVHAKVPPAVATVEQTP